MPKHSKSDIDLGKNRQFTVTLGVFNGDFLQHKSDYKISCFHTGLSFLPSVILRSYFPPNCSVRAVRLKTNTTCQKVSQSVNFLYPLHHLCWFRGPGDYARSYKHKLLELS